MLQYTHLKQWHMHLYYNLKSLRTDKPLFNQTTQNSQNILSAPENHTCPAKVVYET